MFDTDTLSTETSAIEQWQNKTEFECEVCGFEWRQTYIPGESDV